VATLHQRKDTEILQGGGSPPPKKLFKGPNTRDIDSVVSTPVEHQVRPSFGLTVTRISRDIREDFQIPLFERVFDAVVTVEDSQVVRQSVEKLLKYLTDQNKIPPEYLTDERVLFWAKLKDKFRTSRKYDDDFLQKIHTIWSIWDDAAIAHEEANPLDITKSKIPSQTFKIKSKNKNGDVSYYPYKRKSLLLCDVTGCQNPGPFRNKKLLKMHAQNVHSFEIKSISRERSDQETCQALDDILFQEIPNPFRKDFDLELAYEIGYNFGKEFQTWVQDNPDKGAKFRARQLVAMWHQQFSGDDTPEDMVSILKKLPPGKNIIDKIKKLF